MPINKINLSPDELVLHLNEGAEGFDLSDYEDFLYQLCGDWEFQKDAIKKVLKYYLSKKYENSKLLLEENYNNNKSMQSFQTRNDFVRSLSFPDKLACTIDLATGTGKSWVMYAVAMIMLSEGIVDRVLVLCPSRTIKNELQKKFSEFTSRSSLTESLPKRAVIRVPGIKHSDETIEEGDICIDNVHKTYDHVSSSITDSLTGKGQRTLVINDEAHHLLNPKDSDKQSALEWYKFVDDKKYDFRFVLNLSGTPYKGNSYFNDVIYRYSIREAINNKFVKNIDYLSKDTLDVDDWTNRWKAILQHHEEAKKKYTRCKKHITIVVTNKISECNRLTEELISFLKNHTGLDDEKVEKMVIPVTSSPQHDLFKEQLKTVDDPHNPVEWIVSVSMLTEGWDVKNVFQIVPHEKRAFNSKLLISQVLGRGLRIPKEYFGSEIQPKVKVYNHPSWGNKIDDLVREVAEISTVIRSNIIPNSKYNFDLHKVSIKKETVNTKKVEQKNEKIKLPTRLGFSSTNKYKEREFTDVRTKRISTYQTKIEYKTYSLEEATNEIYTTLYVFDMNKGTEITEQVTKDYIRKLIKKELNSISEKEVSEENLQKAKQSFGVLFRSAVGLSEIKELYKEVETINTKNMRPASVSESSFKNNGSLITCEQYYEKLSEEDIEIIESLAENLKNNQTTLSDEDEEFFIRGRVITNITLDQYKSPLNITLLSHKPEREFVEMFLREYVQFADSWIKSNDVGFYSIPYIHRPGTHSHQRDFNPDFFIKKGNQIIVVEIKSDDDSTIMNKDKLEGAMTYFKRLNDKLNGKPYYEFHFLDSRDYKQFFENKLKKNLAFKSKLHADLESKSRSELKEGR